VLAGDGSCNKLGRTEALAPALVGFSCASSVKVGRIQDGRCPCRRKEYNIASGAVVAMAQKLPLVLDEMKNIGG